MQQALSIWLRLKFARYSLRTCIILILCLRSSNRRGTKALCFRIVRPSVRIYDRASPGGSILRQDWRAASIVLLFSCQQFLVDPNTQLPKMWSGSTDARTLARLLWHSTGTTGKFHYHWSTSSACPHSQLFPTSRSRWQDVLCDDFVRTPCDTIRDPWARKATWVNLIYRTETTTKSVKQKN